MKKYTPGPAVLACIESGQLTKAARLAIEELGEILPHNDEGAQQAARLLKRYFAKYKSPPLGLTRTVVRDRWERGRNHLSTPG
jgi:hypothetical protein